MKPWLWRGVKWAAAILLVVCQVTIVPSWSLFGCKPDLPLMVVVVIGLTAGLRGAAWWGGVIGLCLDGVSLAPFGVHTVLLAGAGAVVGSAHLQVNKQYLMVPALVFFVASLAYMAGYLFLEVLIYPNFTLKANVLGRGVGGAVYGAALVPWVLKGFQWMEGWGKRPPPRRRAWSG